MSSRKSLFTVGLSLATLAMIALVGCGDDNTTSSNDRLTGEAYTQSRVEVNALVDSSISVIGNSLATVVIGNSDEDIAQIPGLFFGNGGGDATNDGEWLVITNTTLSTGVTDFVIDSIMYLVNGVSHNDASSADALTVKHLWRRYADDTTLAYENYNVTGALDIEGLDTDNVSVGGTATLSVDSKSTVNQEPVWETVSIVSTYDDVAIGTGSDNWVTGCPTDGTISADVTYISKVGDAAPDTTVLEYLVQFDNGSANIRATSGTQSSVYQQDFCESSSN